MTTAGTARTLKVSIGQWSDKGQKDTNQDFHGAMIPGQPALSLKGIAVALADGISSSDVSAIASESAVKGFLTDYYCTPDSWPVKTSAQRVIAATNSWLHAQTRRGQGAYDKDKGHVCTLSVLVLKSTTAHIFHIGDARVSRVTGNALEPLTREHRVSVSSAQTYLGRALGMGADVEIDYGTFSLTPGDVFVLAVDGVHEWVATRFCVDAIRMHADDLDTAAKAIVTEAMTRGSPDNVTVQIVRVDAVPDGMASEILEQALELPPPPPDPRAEFDGYRILRQLHGSSRGHLYLAADNETGGVVVIKIPSVDLRGDPEYLKRFMMEEWVARRIDSPHVLKPKPPSHARNFLYTVMEFIDGQTLAQWMIDHPRPDLETVRGIVEQIAKGLRAFHRMEMLHQDLRPENVMIDKSGTVKIIDFGSTRVAGVMEATPMHNQNEILGTLQYTAPEYFLGEGGSPCSDLYSLGVLTYQMLTGKLPYGARMARARTRAAQRKLIYMPALDGIREIPAWIDAVLRKAVHSDPNHRYQEITEFVFDLRHPTVGFADAGYVPLIERNPLLFWKTVSFVLAFGILASLVLGHG